MYGYGNWENGYKTVVDEDGTIKYNYKDKETNYEHRTSVFSI